MTSIRSRRVANLVAGGSVAAAAALLFAAPAGAHVSPDKTEVPAGAYTDVQLLVPHGCDGSSTIKVDVQVPAQLYSASPYVVPGWTAEVASEPLDEPVEDAHGNEITERDTTVTWTADEGNALLDGQRINFGIGFQAPEEVGEILFFKTIQTCEEGTSEWITEWDGTGEEPDAPAPSVTVGEAASDGHGSSAEEEETTETTEASTDTAAAATSTDSDDDSSSNGLAIAGLVAGLGGLGLGGAAFAKGRKA